MSAIANLPSPPSVSSNSPPPPSTPLTPNSAHSVSFTPQPANQFAFDGLRLENTTTTTTQPQSSNGGPVRRKPSRRANTAERRATHNAVERQRRETLNGRFLDLAALLPNLASVRRPSKSAIVNSSIALIHTQRRARSTAAREARLLKLEADALRAEVNEWRERAGMGMARIEEPPRSREFDELVNGGLEEAEESLLEEERRALETLKEGLRMDMGGDMMVGGPFAFNMNGGGMYGLAEEDDDDSSDGQPAGRAMRPGSQGSNNSIPPIPVAVPSQNSHPMIFDPTAAMLQSHPTHQAGINAYPSYDLGVAHQSLGLAGLTPTINKSQQQQQQAWNAQMFAQSYGQQQQPQQQMFTPPSVGFLGGFGLRDDDTVVSPASSVSDFGGYSVHPSMNARTRSPGSLANIQTSLKAAGTPPLSAPASTYAEVSSAGDAFAAAYGAFPVPTRVSGGGNTYGAAMGLFM